MDALLTIGDLVELEIEKLVFGGEGFARHQGRAVFVPFTAPGERVRAEIVRVERSWARGRLDSILTASPDRRPAPCALFGECGGCQLQHLARGAQLAAKAEFVREALRRIGKIEWERAIEVRASDELGYRSRAELQVARGSSGARTLGYFAAGSHDVREVERCPILAPALEHELARLRAEPQRIPSRAARVHLAAGDEEVGAVFVDANDEVLPRGDDPRGDDIGFVTQRVAGFDYRFHPHSFFQANRALIDVLVESATGESKGTLALDLYAGVGLFTLPLARRFAAVMAIEENAGASELCVANARANRIANVKCEALPVEEWLEQRAKARLRPDLVLLDPPRAGAGPRVLHGVLRLEPAAITYVSCDPTTLARDLRTLLERGWKLASIVALDMFPQTYHVETVVRLECPAG